MQYVYVLKSRKDSGFYVGRTNDLHKRFQDHQKGRAKSTKDRGPWILQYYEASRNIKDAVHREKYLKTAWGKRYLKHRLKSESA